MSTAAPALVRPGLPRLTGVELRKSADTRAGFWLLLVIVLLAAALVVVQLIWGEASEHHLAPLFRTTIEITELVLPVLGILLVTSEWSQRTGLTTFALVPMRERVVLAKAVAAVILTVCAVAGCLLVAAVGNVFGGGDWNVGFDELGRYTLYQVIGVLGGVAFGLAFLNSALAIVMYFVLPIAWAILGEAINALDKPADWLDLSRPKMALIEGGMTGTEWAQLATATAVWVGVVAAIGLIRLRRTELK
jgi:ABC-2 type transport system permease protein